MSDIQMKGIESRLGQAILDDVESLKHSFWHIFENSDQIALEYLIGKTKTVLSHLNNNSKTYLERYQLINSLNEEWFKLWQKYKHSHDHADLIQSIDNLTDYSVAYTYFFYGLSLINEGKTGDKKHDSERVVNGFLWLSQILDVFCNYFSKSELDQIFESATNIFESYNRSASEYFAEDIEISFLNTQLRAYCCLIIQRINQQKYSAKDLYLSKECFDYTEGQNHLFNQNLSNLVDRYAGKYVLFENGKVIDSDLSEDALFDRVWESNFMKGRQIKSIFIKQVPQNMIVNA